MLVWLGYFFALSFANIYNYRKMTIKELIDKWLKEKSEKELHKIHEDLMKLDEPQRLIELDKMQWYFPERVQVENFFIELSESNDDFLAKYIEDKFELVRVAQNPAQLPENEPKSEDSDRVRLSSSNVLYARTSFDFDHDMVKAAADSLMSKGFDKIELIRPSHLPAVQGIQFVAALRDRLVDMGMEPAAISVAKPEPISKPVKPEAPSPEEKGGFAQPDIFEIPPEELSKKGNKLISKVDEALGTGASKISIYEFVESLASRGVGLNYITSDSGNKGFTYRDRENNRVISGSKAKFESYTGKNLLGFGGDALRGRLDYDFELEDFFAATIKVASDRVKDKGVSLSAASINKELGLMNSQFKLSEDLTSVKGYKYLPDDIDISSSRAKQVIESSFLERIPEPKPEPSPIPATSSKPSIPAPEVPAPARPSSQDQSPEPSPAAPHESIEQGMPPVSSYEEMPPIGAYGDMPEPDYDDFEYEPEPDCGSGQFLNNVMASTGQKAVDRPVPERDDDLGEKLPEKKAVRPRLALAIY